MGSQIFDYWFDLFNFILEYYVDGDLLDMNELMYYNKVVFDNLYVWGECFGLISDYLFNVNLLYFMLGFEVLFIFL